MSEKVMNAKEINDAIALLVQQIRQGKASEWQEEASGVSLKIKNALFARLNEKVKKLSDEKGVLLELCNCVKSILIVYNFGEMQDKTLDGTEEKNFFTALNFVLDYVNDDKKGFDLSTYVSPSDCLEIFSKETADGEYNNVPVTFTVATVFTTLVYLRRAIKREQLFFANENWETNGVFDRVVKTMRKIIDMLLNYVWKNNYKGWGATVDPTFSKRVTLNDTFFVVEAISRYQDAFDKKGSKRDQDFMDLIDAEGVYSGSRTENLMNAMYRVAVSIYESAKDVYGVDAFYADGTSYELQNESQLMSSNRSSALFNPLYVAMITMLGYAEKELVIRRFMDDYKLASRYDAQEGEAIEKYAMEELGYQGDYQTDKALVVEEHAKRSNDYSSENKELWNKTYEIARVFQKYLETQKSDDLMRINEYRDYLNATKDAIDRVQVLYRKFNDRQRLGAVDTDYVMYTSEDIDAETIRISRLNKGSIAVNNIRPMLLSSKIMIVNALTKYPQSDISSLYTAIIDSQNRESKKSQKAKDPRRWLWNEDEIDMNATARCCEAIEYDYFSYYEEYELGFLAMRQCRQELDKRLSVDAEDGSLLVSEEELKAVDGFQKLVLGITRENVDSVKMQYKENLDALRNKHKEDLVAKETEKAIALQAKDVQIEEKARDILRAEEDNLKLQNLQAEENALGRMLKSIIDKEIARYFKRILSAVVFERLNDEGKDVEKTQAYYQAKAKEYFDEGLDLSRDGNFDCVKEYVENKKILYKQDEEKASVEYASDAQDAKTLSAMFALAFDGALNNRMLVDKEDIANEYAEMKKEMEGFVMTWWSYRDREKGDKNKSVPKLSNFFDTFRGSEYDVFRGKSKKDVDDN